MSSPHNYTRLLAEFIETVCLLGPQQTSELLKEKRTIHSLQNDHVNFVISSVAESFEINVEELLSGTRRKNDRIIALGFCVYYLHSPPFSYDMKDVRYLLHMQLPSCYKYYNRIKTLDPGHRADERYVQIKSRLDEKLLSRNNKKLK